MNKIDLNLLHFMHELIDQANSVTGVYFHINLDVQWQTVTKELPPVVVSLEQMIAESDTT